MFALGSSVSVFIQTVRGWEERNFASKEKEKEKEKEEKKKKEKSKICNPRSIELFYFISLLL